MVVLKAITSEWRRFTAGQLAHIDDYRNSPYTGATAHRQVYRECFALAEQFRFASDMSRQLWFNGLSRRILLRSCSGLLVTKQQEIHVLQKCMHTCSSKLNCTLTTT